MSDDTITGSSKMTSMAIKTRRYFTCPNGCDHEFIVEETLRVLAVVERRPTDEILDDMREAPEPTAGELLTKAIEAIDAAGLVFDASNLREACNELMITNGLVHARTSLHRVIAAAHVSLSQRIAARRALRALGAAWAARGGA